MRPDPRLSTVFWNQRGDRGHGHVHKLTGYKFDPPPKTDPVAIGAPKN